MIRSLGFVPVAFELGVDWLIDKLFNLFSRSDSLVSAKMINNIEEILEDRILWLS